MKTLTMSLAFAALVLVVPGALQAQTIDKAMGLGGLGGYGTFPFYSYSSTAAEGYQRGRAAVIQAEGDYNYNTSLAAVNLEEAARQDIINRYASVKNYFEVKKLNEQYRYAAVGRRATSEELIKYSKMAAPKRLNSYQFEPVIGTIHWPAIFRRAEFDPFRQRLDDLFAERTYANSGLGSDNYKEVQYIAAALEADLKDMITQMKPAEYVLAKRFIESLSYESQFVPGAQGVAVN